MNIYYQVSNHLKLVDKDQEHFRKNGYNLIEVKAKNIRDKEYSTSSSSSQ